MKKPEDFDNLLRNLRAGNNITDSCKLSGIARSVYYEWYDKYPEKKEKIDKALVECKARNLTLVQRAAQGVKAVRIITKKDGTKVEEEYWLEVPDWRAAAWTLERKWPGEFREHRETEHSGRLTLEEFLSDDKSEEGTDKE